MSHLALARKFVQSRQFDKAIPAYIVYLAYHPTDIAGWRELCLAQGRTRDFAAMLSSVDRLEALGFDATFELDQVALALMHRCDWSRRQALERRIASCIARGAGGKLDAMARFAAIDDPLTHFRLASQKSELVASQTKSLSRPSVPRIARGVIKERLRIGYISNDLNNNVMSLLIAGILEQHNRDRFEVTVYDYSREDGSPLRQRIMKAPEHFVAITKLSTEQCAEKVSLDEVDVLVDLKGHFYGARSDILALRPAPVQVNFLGFVGTHASNWIDYVIADRQVLPVAERINWTERVIYMPHSYFPNDRSRPVPREPIPGVRTKFGLPEAGIVFACFNSPHKITPGVFALWMRILRELPDSVLWLVATEQCIIVNLREQAMYAGVLPHRLVFAPKVSFADHIERHSYADIWLDTMYNGHTTAADSLWSGLPVVTLCGRSFAARVGASLLNAVGLPELICNTPDDYVKLAIELALDAEKRRTLRDHLVAARDASPLFDASRFARDLERAFTAIASKNRAGLKPENIYLTPQSDLME